jgi:magnesium chelatase family protein
VEVTPVPFRELSKVQASEKSELVRERVIGARKIQEDRFQDLPGVYSNAQMNTKLLQKYCNIDEAGLVLLRNAMEKLSLSARAYDRILKVARTIADLDNSLEIQNHHLAEAIQYRSLDRENWAG